ncbi:MAG: PAS domain S-box protein, partial [Chloroflexi bacterium]|nr:PAS domain S-box protein [Chloroflexota bacterium]
MIPITRNSTQKPGISPWHPGTLWHSLTEPVISIQKPEQRRQMRLLSSLLIALIFLALLASILVLFFPNAVANFRIVVMAVVVLAFAYRLSRTRHYTLAAVLMVSVTLASVFTATLINPQAYTIGFLALGILLCSLLLSLWATVIVFMVTLIGIALLLAVVPGLFWQNFVDALYLVGCVGALAIIAAAIHQQDLRQIEQQSHQLSEREKRFLALIEHSSDAITLVRSDGTILYASPALSRILGFPLEDLGHAVLLDLAHPEDRALIEAWWTALIQEPGKLSTQQYRMRHRDGAWRWLEITAHNLLAEPSVQAIVNTFRDITEHKEAQVLLEEAERRYRMLFEEAPVMYVISRHQGKSPIIADCNQLFLSTLGYTHAEVLGRPVADFYTPKSHSLLRQNGYQQAAAGQFFVQERELVKRDGQVVKTLLHARPDVDQAGHVLGVRATYVDITERTHAEEQIKHQIERLAALRAIDLAIIASTDLHLSLSAVMNATIKQLQMDAAAILILNAHTQILECAEQIGFHTRVQPRNRLHLGEGHGG